MPLLEETLEVDRPLEDVFAFVGDFANTKDWDPGVAGATKVTDGPIEVGTRYAVDVVFNGRTLPMTYEVTAWDPPNHVALMGEGSTVRAVDDIRFEATETGTRIRYSADLRLKGVLRLVEPFLGKRFDETGKAAMAGMRRALEG
jgi:dehydrogenase/reductase SDR family member 12